MNDKRKVHVILGVHFASVRTYWANSAIIFEDQSGDLAPRKVTLKIERPGDLVYIRDQLDAIERAWRKELDAIRVTPAGE